MTLHDRTIPAVGQLRRRGGPPTTRLADFDLPRRQWSPLNCFRTGQKGHSGASRKKQGLTENDLGAFGEIHTVARIVNSAIDYFCSRQMTLTSLTIVVYDDDKQQ